MSQVAVFLFRNDLRVEDNTALHHAIEENDVVIPIYIYTKINNEKYTNFLFECLSELPVCILNNMDELKAIIKKYDVSKLYLNKDVALGNPDIRGMKELKVMSYDDRTLLHSDPNRKQYLRFSPFLKFLHKNPKLLHTKIINSKPLLKKLKVLKSTTFATSSGSIRNKGDNVSIGGRRAALKILAKNHKPSIYLDQPSSKISAYLNLGCVSIREVYNSFKNKDLRRQLLWREFFCQNFEHYKGIQNARGRVEQWATANEQQRNKFKEFTKGRTGVPIVDAGIRELLATGFMHNRARLNVAFYLIKTMNWHWKDGERFFAKHLIDYDIIQNTSNWQWCAGVGTDSRPNRHLNYERQAKKYDPKGIYISSF